MTRLGLGCALALTLTAPAVAELPSPAISYPAPARYEVLIKRDWLTMSDGVRLSVTYFLPQPKTPDEKFPVLLELLPYRKDDLFYIRDYPLYHWFAQRGYAMAKVDVRGTGSSHGTVPDREYSDVELDDAVQLVALLAKQPFSTGAVGMWGISWGGFNALMTAMRRPPELKAILALHASDDLFHDDVHYIDGALHIDPYALEIDHELGMPQSPDYVLDESWQRQRFEAYPWLLTYLERPVDSEWWQSRSLRFHPESIQVPVYLIGGWLDGYRDTVLRALDYLKVSVKAEIGPWNHNWPDTGEPGPNHEWRQQALRWWDRWLKGVKNGVDEEPRLSLFLRAGHAPGEDAKQVPGYWVQSDWKPNARASVRWQLLSGGVLGHTDRTSAGPATLTRAVAPATGTAAGVWWGEPTADMQHDVEGCFVFDSAPLSKPITVAGFPNVVLRIGSSSPVATFSTRLEDRARDGRVALVTGALQPGTQRVSREAPKPMPTDRPVRLQFNLHATSWTFGAGHQVRLTVCGAQFPMAWPGPANSTLTLTVDAESSLELPTLRNCNEADVASEECLETMPSPLLFRPEPRAERPDAKELSGGDWPAAGTVTRDTKRGVVRYEWRGNEPWQIGQQRFHTEEQYRYEVSTTDSAHASFFGQIRDAFEAKAGRFTLETKFDVRSDATTFYVTVTRTVWRGKQKFREKVWAKSLPRGLM
ncbi:MAG: CocE/NonD family hydrolase [Acidobacteriota bacterium]